MIRSDAKSEPDKVLWVIYASLLSGVLLFAVAVRGVMPAGSVGMDLDTVAWAAPVLAILAVFGAGFVHGRLAAGAKPGVRRSSAIIVWALSEGAALFGLVIVLITGSLYPAGVGALMAFLTMAFYHPGRFQ